MNNHCWQNGRKKVSENDEIAWPKLSSSTSQERSLTRSIMRSHVPQLYVESAGSSVEIDPLAGLDEFDYPKLGENVYKRKHNLAECDSPAIADHFADRGERRIRIPRSTDLIRVDLQKTLERQISWPIPLLSNKSAKRTFDICKLNVNMSVTSPLARWLLVKAKRKTMHIVKKKKPSRLKHLILYERMMRKHRATACRSEIQRVPLSPDTKKDNISAIDFDSLHINVVSNEDPELLKKMSSLSCLSANYRDSREIDNSEEDAVHFRPDLDEKMKNLSIKTRDVSDSTNYENNDSSGFDDKFIDSDTMNATKSLKICDETEVCGNDKACNDKEPIDRVKFTKKFREYCTNTITSDLKTHLNDFLIEISRLQRKMYERDSVKGKIRRRYYAGIKEVQKHIDLNKIKFVIIASDLEKVEIEGGLDDALRKLVGTCKRYEVPYCFGFERRKLGYHIHGKGLVSCIGISNYSSAEEQLKSVLLDVVEARNEFSRLMYDEAKIIDVEKLLPKEELLLSEIINAYLRILASTS